MVFFRYIIANTLSKVTIDVVVDDDDDDDDDNNNNNNEPKV